MNNWLELLKNDDYLGIKKYIKSGGDIKETNDLGESVLACAIRAHCELETLMLLVENGADIFDFDDEGETFISENVHTFKENSTLIPISKLGNQYKVCYNT